MPWTYEQNTGNMYDPSGALSGKGYAGGCSGLKPEAINNHKYEQVPDVGPLPLGRYTLGTPVPQSKLGPFAIPLVPDASNTMYGRGHFFCHGDTSPAGRASHGCIIQARAVRNAMWASSDHDLDVVLL